MSKRKIVSDDLVTSDDDRDVSVSGSDATSDAGASSSKAKKSKPDSSKSTKSVKKDEDKKKDKKKKVESDDEQDDDVYLQENDEGESFIQLPSNKRITINKFKGKSLVHIRETYEKDGKTLPGKKGIALTPEQYKLFKQAIPHIDQALRNL
ncbi:hypothetical protein ACM66B_005762 [Microbotryomycetes sp. NB124-2]